MISWQAVGPVRASPGGSPVICATALESHSRRAVLSWAVGVPVAKTKIGLFMGVGLCGWLLGMHNLFAFDSVQSGEGVGNEFLYIIGAVIGGCLLTGGFGSAIGGALGALIFGIASRGIVYAEWNPDWFKFFLGLMLLLATIVNMYVRKRVERK